MLHKALVRSTEGSISESSWSPTRHLHWLQPPLLISWLSCALQGSMFGNNGAPAWPAPPQGLPGGVPSCDEFMPLAGAISSPAAHAEHALPLALPVGRGLRIVGV